MGRKWPFPCFVARGQLHRHANRWAHRVSAVLEESIDALPRKVPLLLACWLAIVALGMAAAEAAAARAVLVVVLLLATLASVVVAPAARLALAAAVDVHGTVAAVDVDVVVAVVRREAVPGLTRVAARWETLPHALRMVGLPRRRVARAMSAAPRLYLEFLHVEVVLPQDMVSLHAGDEMVLRTAAVQRPSSQSCRTPLLPEWMKHSRSYWRANACWPRLCQTHQRSLGKREEAKVTFLMRVMEGGQASDGRQRLMAARTTAMRLLAAVALVATPSLLQIPNSVYAILVAAPPPSQSARMVLPSCAGQAAALPSAWMLLQMATRWRRTIGVAGA